MDDKFKEIKEAFRKQDLDKIKKLEETLQELLERTDDYCDEGPEGEQWDSDELSAIRHKARKLLNNQ